VVSLSPRIKAAPFGPRLLVGLGGSFPLSDTDLKARALVSLFYSLLSLIPSCSDAVAGQSPICMYNPITPPPRRFATAALPIPGRPATTEALTIAKPIPMTVV